MGLYELAGLFLIYAFLGWCVEVCYAALKHGKVVNRGFLNGPVCPIYGVGMIGALLLLAPISDQPVVLFFGGMILCSLVELVGGWILKRVFDTRWWDYSEEPFNLGGYICLRFSIIWGLAVVFVIRLVHPMILGMLLRIPHTLGLVLEIVLWALFLTDFVMTLVVVIGIRRRITEMERVAEALHTVGDAISDRLGNTALAADARIETIKENGQEKLEEKREKWENIATMSRDELQARRAELEERKKQLLAENRSRRGFMFRRLTQAFPAIQQAVESHVAQMDQE